MKAVVTGCAGFIGSHLSERLLTDGWSVVGIDSIAPTYDTFGRRRMASSLAAHPSFEFIEGNLNRIDLSPHVLEADVVFHLAARPGVRASWKDFAQVSDANILATQRVLDSLSQSPETRLVFSSSSSVYGQAMEFPVNEDRPLSPISPYGVSKVSCEALLSAYAGQFGLTATSLRYFTVYGPRQRSDMAFTRWIGRIFHGEPIRVFGDGTAVRDFTYVSDVVEATVRAGEDRNPGHDIYNVAGGSPVTLGEVFEILRNLIKRDFELVHEEPALGDPKRTGGDTTAISRALGWKPSMSLEAGLQAQVAWYRDSGLPDEMR